MTYSTRSGQPVRIRLMAAAYLNARLRDAGHEEFSAVLGRIAEACGGTALAEKVELSSEMLYRTLSQRGNPDLKATATLLRAMGLRLVLQPIGAP